MFKPLSNFDFSKPELWKEWIDRFKRFRLAAKLTKETQEIQINSLLYSMGPEAEKVFAQLRFDANGDSDKYDKVVKKLNAYFTPQVNVIHERCVFNQRNQAEGENVECYVRTLHELAQRAQFQDQEEAMRDRLVLGIRDRELS
jgi:hypothetical protein